jgi:nitrate reductase cytochrome c-type subunit
MKKLLVFIAAAVLLASVASAQVDVKGYWKDTNHDGVKDTYVQPHHRTAPNETIRDNYSTQPNVNPYSGERGQVNPNSNPFAIQPLPTFGR